MFKSKFISRIIAAVLLTGALIADTYQIGAVASDGQVSEARFRFPKVVSGHKTYNPDNTFKGCDIGGVGCGIIMTSVGDVTISNEGIHIQ